MILRPQYDDMLVYAPSFILAEQMEAAGEVFEGKAIGTAQIADLSLAQDLVKMKDADPVQFADARKKGQTVGKRKTKEVQARTEKALLKLIGEWDDGTLYDTELRKGAHKVMKTAWKDVFLAGLRAGGTPGEGAGKGKTLVKLSPGDDKWLRGAMQHEMRFLNRFVTAVVDETYVMPLPRRVKMYVHALNSFYESARVISLPSNVVLHWKGPNDKKTCPSCQYLFEHTPYVKYILPTTPRAGLTICLTNCRDYILARRVDPFEAEKKIKESKFTRGTHIKKLRKIKRTGKL